MNHHPEIPDTSDDREWEDVEIGEQDKRPSGVVISVRFPREVAEYVATLAKQRSVPVSVVIRDAVRACADAARAGIASSEITVSAQSNAPTAFYSRPATVGRTSAPEARLEPVAG